MRISYNRPLLITFTLVVLFSFNLSIPQLVQHSEAVPSVYTSEIAAKNNPFHKTSGSDQLIYDYFPSNDKKVTDSGTSNLVNQLINNLVEEKFAKPEICGDGQDNDGNGQVDENCSVGNSPNNSPKVIINLLKQNLSRRFVEMGRTMMEMDRLTKIVV